jgi:LmbE family N-acetylglucosaminyl deacetylase
VVLVVATRGEHAGFGHELLAEGEDISQRRVDETHKSAEILGASRVEFLDYVDSGMMGTPENQAPGSFWRADVDEAARQLAKILEDERADVLTVYDGHGNYGHPDHIQVHRVGVRAAELVGTPLVYEATINRDHVRRMLEEQIAGGNDVLPGGLDPADLPDPDDSTFGSPESIITTTVDVREFIDRKRAAMEAHASQIAESHFFLKMPPDMFREAFGYESFIHRGVPSDTREKDLFEALP